MLQNYDGICLNSPHHGKNADLEQLSDIFAFEDKGRVAAGELRGSGEECTEIYYTTMLFNEILANVFQFATGIVEEWLKHDSKHKYLVSKLSFSLELSHWRRLNLEKENMEVRDIKKLIRLNLLNTANLYQKCV